METKTSIFGTSNRFKIFTAVKYLTYALLFINIFLFLQEEVLALEHTFAGDLEIGQVIQSFAATIDTASWVLLLLLFELETSVLDDSKIKGATKWLLHGVRGLCYIAIVYAFTGYYAELIAIYDVTLTSIVDPCTLIAQDLSVLITIDEYLPLDAESCAAMGSDIYRQNGFAIISDGETLNAVQRLAWTDLINSAAWILVVVLLEIEVRLQLRGNLTDGIMSITKVVKFVLYGTLFLAAVFWGFKGDLLDFWDASMWLFAFVFIEMNVFEWQYETTQHEDAN
ncbi:MAG: hypothetical protein AB8B81_08805 [Halioglobus sp.]